MTKSASKRRCNRHSAPEERALADAEDVYRKILLRWHPIIPMCCTIAACSPITRGGSEQAVALIQRSLELLPDQADCYSNLGIIYNASRGSMKRSRAYQRAIVLNPDHVNAYNNLGILLRATGKPSNRRRPIERRRDRSGIHRRLPQPGHSAGEP